MLTMLCVNYILINLGKKEKYHAGGFIFFQVLVRTQKK